METILESFFFVKRYKKKPIYILSASKETYYILWWDKKTNIFSMTFRGYKQFPGEICFKNLRINTKEHLDIILKASIMSYW